MSPKTTALEADWIENRKQQEHATQRRGLEWLGWPPASSLHWDCVILTRSSLSLNQSRDKDGSLPKLNKLNTN
jgi:hypothetical protein